MIGVYFESKADYRIQYVFDLVFDILGYSHRFISKDELAQNEDFDTMVCYCHMLEHMKINKKLIIIPREKNGNTLKWSKPVDKTIFSFDFIEKIYEIISRKEEKSGPYDKHRRFIAINSKIYKRLDDPIINEYIRIFDEAIQSNASIPLVKKLLWPGGKEFAACISFDVDVVDKYDLMGILSTIKKSFFALVKIRFVDFLEYYYEMISFLIRRVNPYWQLENIRKTLCEYGIKGTFFFCPKRKHKFDVKYSLKNKKLIDMIKLLQKEGHEIGLHTSYTSAENTKEIIEERKILEKYGFDIKGCRNHFLRFNVGSSEDNISTWDRQFKAKLQYDSTLGYSGEVGFRPGFCFPYKPISFDGSKKIDIMELPLSIMDAAVFIKNYKYDDARETVFKLIEHVKKNKGLLVMDWHQRVFYYKDFPMWGELFNECLKFFQKSNVFLTNCIGIVNWWKIRDGVKINEMIDSDGNWKFIISSKKNIYGLSLEICNTDKNNIEIIGCDKYEICDSGTTFIFNEIKQKDEIIILVTKS